MLVVWRCVDNKKLIRSYNKLNKVYFSFIDEYIRQTGRTGRTHLSCAQLVQDQGCLQLPEVR